MTICGLAWWAPGPDPAGTNYLYVDQMKKRVQAATTRLPRPVS